DRLLARHPQVDAIFFNNDDVALGALFRARQLEIAVPQRLAIAGFNDLPAAAWVHPALTTVRTARGRIGQLAAEMLLGLMRGEQPAQRRIDVGFEVVLRDSA
ncbi:substrate-binding domain-containing protein, partial [Pseudomonas indica]